MVSAMCMKINGEYLQKKGMVETGLGVECYWKCLCVFLI